MQEAVWVILHLQQPFPVLRSAWPGRRMERDDREMFGTTSTASLQSWQERVEEQRRETG